MGYIIMIEIRKAKPGDETGHLISKGALRGGRGDLVMVILEDDKVMGCCSMDFEGKEGLINSLYIENKTGDSNLADGLIRSVLYSALRRNIEWVRLPLTEQTEGFLRGLGFENIQRTTEELQINPETFFKDCDCCGESRCINRE